MSQTDATSYMLLDSRQGRGPSDGWRELYSSGVEIVTDGLRLAPQPSPPIPLKDAQGTLGGLENPTGVTVGPDGAIYVADAASHRVYRIVRRDRMRARAKFFLITGGQFAKDRIVYVATAGRLERWPRALGRDPASLDEVEVICGEVWDETEARKGLLRFLRGGGAGEEEGKTGGCGCGCGSGSAGRAKASGGCGCGGGRVSGGSGSSRGGAGGGCGSGCCDECREAAGEGEEESSVEREWDGLYPSHLPAGKACESSVECLPCLGGLGTRPRRFNEPRGLAVSPCGDLYVADSKNHRVQVFSTTRALATLAVWGKRASASDLSGEPEPEECAPGEGERRRAGDWIAGDRAGEFKEPWDVVLDAAGNVYVADRGNHRVQRYDRRARRFHVFDGTALASHFFQILYGASMRERFAYVPARQRLERWPRALGRDPQNIGEVEIISDRVGALEDARRLVLAAVGAKGATDILVEWDASYPSALAAFPQPEEPFSSPSHLAVDARGQLYVVDADRDHVKILDGRGRVVGRVQFREELAADFEPVAVYVDEDGKLLLAGAGGIFQFRVVGGAYRYEGQRGAWRGRCAGVATGAGGALLAIDTLFGGVAEVPAPAGFVREGTFIAGPLDSRVESCQWHKLLLRMDGAPPLGTSVTVYTYADARERTADQILALRPEDWQTGLSNASDFLVLSGPGRYLWLKIALRGSGAETPELGGLKAHFPRNTYLEYLPAVYQSDPVSKDFLERFLSIFETTLSGIEGRVSNIWQYFNPEGVPDVEPPKDFLSWLAGWVGMTFEPGWTTATRRRLLRHSPELYCKRGTPAGLKLLLRLALDIEVEVLEHFQMRRWVFLASQSSLCAGAQLWGNCIVNRLQLDENSRVGDFALDATPDPARDPFFVYAHKFSVFVKRGELDDAGERMMRRLIEQAKPAHTQYDLVRVEPRLRVGMQSTLGLDTQVGIYPRAVLGRCATLGYDTLLGCGDSATRGGGRPALRVGAGAPLGSGAGLG